MEINSFKDKTSNLVKNTQAQKIDDLLFKLGYQETKEANVWRKDMPLGSLFIDLGKKKGFIELVGYYESFDEIEQMKNNLIQVNKDLDIILKE